MVFGWEYGVKESARVFGRLIWVFILFVMFIDFKIVCCVKFVVLC